jgi:hypothetical protein
VKPELVVKDYSYQVEKPDQPVVRFAGRRVHLNGMRGRWRSLQPITDREIAAGW